MLQVQDINNFHDILKKMKSHIKEVVVALEKLHREHPYKKGKYNEYVLYELETSSLEYAEFGNQLWLKDDQDNISIEWEWLTKSVDQIIKEENDRLDLLKINHEKSLQKERYQDREYWKKTLLSVLEKYPEFKEEIK